MIIQKAARFAARAHDGVCRKGGSIPYICHPMEVALIVSQMTDDEEVIAAAYLHDVLEDTAVAPQEIAAAFGERVLSLVLAETEDKSLPWRMRKENTIAHLPGAPREVQLIALGDKLSNMRSTAADYLAHGDEVWLRFHEKRRECHGWYMRGVIEGLSALSDLPAYQELKTLYEFVYGS